jgi:hypothetical protein
MYQHIIVPAHSSIIVLDLDSFALLESNRWKVTRMYGEDKVEDRFGIQPYWEIPRSSLQGSWPFFGLKAILSWYRGWHSS